MNTEQSKADQRPVLVAYATRYGSTRDVAESIAGKLREAGFPTDLRPAGEVRDTSAYRAVVLGAPFYLGRWHEDAREFLETHRESLEQRPVAVFALGPIGGADQEKSEAREQLDTEVGRHPWLRPIAVEMFGGKYDPARLGFGHRLLTLLPASPLHGMGASDLRDWAAIDAWAGELSGSIRANSPR